MDFKIENTASIVKITTTWIEGNGELESSEFLFHKDKDREDLKLTLERMKLLVLSNY